ncbi:MAG TPA: hypothetical protein GX017_09395 [Clostridiales bacterium]|jgi:hypothetical protein|nr:hypothetical protein [Clostridiales bacterium]
MRKIVSLLLTLLLFISMRTAATAATITAVPGSDSMDVMATYEPGGTSEIIYSVDISWGSMEFTYTSATEGTWDPETHTYGGSSQGTWSCDNDANKITVTNHSNTAITALLVYEAEESYDEITGTFDIELLEFETAEETEVQSAPSKSAKLTLSGELPDDTDSVKIGSVTVTINEPLS